MARPRKYASSSVISFRISDEELHRLNQMVNIMRIPRSDVMRLALELVAHSPLHTWKKLNMPTLPSPGTM